MLSLKREDQREELRDLLPETYSLDSGDLRSLADYLMAGGRLAPDETLLGVEKDGKGNMNCTVRVRTSGGPFTLRQSRPWLEKYPQIAAPFDRALAEGRFYRLIAASAAVAGRMLRLLGTDDAAQTLIGLLRQLALYVQTTIQSNAAYGLAEMLYSGFDAASTNRAQSPLDTPSISGIDNSGCVVSCAA